MSFSLSIEEILEATQGQLFGCNDKSIQVSGYQTDSRKKISNEIFIPLVGDSHDAHDFIDSAIANGAHIILTHKNLDWSESICYIKVADTLKALQDLANYWRRYCNYKVLAISGSNGKTTSKEYALSILKQKYKVTASVGSFNNHWGVPFTILNSNIDDEVLILEMGMNHLGELKTLSQIGEQDVSVLTTVGRAHVGEVGSFESIINAKKELYDFSSQALHVFNLDNEQTKKMYDDSNQEREMTFSSHNPSADVYLKVLDSSISGLTISGTIKGVEGFLEVPVFGEHNIYNIMVASCLALSCGMRAEEIWQYIPKVKGAWGRCDLLKTEKGVQVLFDAYNANPESVGALHKNLTQLPFDGKKIFILGDMLEMGSDSPQFHLDIFNMFDNFYDCIWYIGEHKELAENVFKEKNVKFMHSFKFEQNLATELYSQLEADDTVVMKGSRGIALEKIVQAWGLDYSK